MENQTKVTRRSIMGAAGLGTALAVIGAGANAAETKAQVFALIGDAAHNSDYIRSALGGTLVRDAGLAAAPNVAKLTI